MREPHYRRIGEAIASGIPPEDWRSAWAEAYRTARVMMRYPRADPGYSEGWLYKFAWDIARCVKLAKRGV